MVLDDFLEQEYPLKTLLKILALPRSSYYYRSTGTKAGKRVSNIFNKDGTYVTKDTVVEDIKELLSGEFIDYGYYKTYVHLTRELSYSIGSSKTYQIMKENKLLKFQRDKHKKINRNWVKDLVPQVQQPFNFLEFDIKYVYVHGTRSNLMVLTVLDVFTRWNLGQYMAYSITKENVIDLFNEIVQKYQMPERFIVRNDNGSQFVKHRWIGHCMSLHWYFDHRHQFSTPQNARYKHLLPIAMNQASQYSLQSYFLRR